MSLTPQQIWIAKFTGGAGLTDEQSDELDLDAQLAVQQQIERRQEIILRETYLTRAHKEAAGLSAELEVFRTARIETTSGKMDMIGEGGDQTKGFGYEEDMSSVKRSPKEIAAMTNAKGKVIAIQKGLQAVMVKRSHIDRDNGVLVAEDMPLFEARDIENELFTPLVRSLLYPEDQVSGEFSATQRMIDGSNQFYIDELVARSEVDNSVEELGGALKSVVSAVKDVTSATVGMIASVDISQASSSDQVLKIMDTQSLIDLGLTVGEAVINTSIDVGIAISKSDAAAGVSVVLSGLSGAVSGLVKQFTGDADLAKYIGIGMKGGSRLPHMVAAFTGSDDPEVKVGKFVDQLGGLFGDAFDIIGVVENNPDDPNNTQNQKELAAVKSGVTTAYAGVAAALKGQIIGKVAKGDWRGVAQVTISVAGIVVKGGLAGVGAQEAIDKKAAISADEDGAIKQSVIDTYGLDDPNFDDLYDKAKLAEQAKVDAHFAMAASQIGDSVDKLSGGLSTLIEQGRDNSDALADKIKERERVAKEEQDKLNRTASEDAARRLQEEEEEFQETLRLLGKEQMTETDLKSIGKLIAKMQRDRAIMETASALGGAGFAVASQFFAPMAIAGTLIKFLELLTAAVNRAIELRNWVDASTLAFNAVSPYYTAIENFVTNQAVQFSHYTIKCTLVAIQAAAQIVQVAGSGTYAQAVGLIVEKGAKLAETIEDLTYKFYKEVTLRKAWKVTKPALKDPNNRKANLIARRINPTLAKYTLAFGATIDKDPVALEAFRIIGLDAETLASKDAKVDSVKNYLETRYNEDVQVYRSFEVETDDSWLLKAPAPALTADCFLTLHFLAVSKGGVSDTKPDAITKAFRDLEEDKARFTESTRAIDNLDVITDSALSPHLDVFAEYESALKDIRSLLNGFAPPKTGSTDPDDDLQSAIKQLSELADVEISTVELERSDIFGRAAQIPPAPAPKPEDARALLKRVGDEMNKGEIEDIALDIEDDVEDEVEDD